MQLAARRTVTREEDQVYSIMGLLNVEISIAYGEGAKHALRRLPSGISGLGHHMYWTCSTTVTPGTGV